MRIFSTQAVVCFCFACFGFNCPLPDRCPLTAKSIGPPYAVFCEHFRKAGTGNQYPEALIFS